MTATPPEQAAPLTAEQAHEAYDLLDEVDFRERDNLDIALAAIASGQHAVYDTRTHCVVPLRPTKAILQVMHDCETNHGSMTKGEAWEAMLAAAKGAPQRGQ